MASVEAVGDVAAFDCVAEVELVRADGVGFGTDAEELGLDGVEVVFGVEFFGEDFFEGSGEAFAGGGPVKGGVLGAVGYPNIGDGAGAEYFAEVGADAAGGGAVVDPELTDFFVAVRKRAVGGERVGEAGWVEIEAVEIERSGPVHPGGEVFWFDGVAFDGFAGEVGVDGVEVEAVATGDEFIDEFQVLAELSERAGFAGIVAGGLDAAAGERGAGFFETADVVALPAVEGDGCGGESDQGGFDIHAEGGVGVAGGSEGGGGAGGRFAGGHGGSSKGASVAGLPAGGNMCVDLNIQNLGNETSVKIVCALSLRFD